MHKAIQDEQGVVLIVVTVVTVLLALLGLSLAVNSMNEFSASHDMENHGKAFMVADAGFSTFKDALRGVDVNAVLAGNTQVPQFINYSVPTGTALTYFSRNPIAPIELMNVDMENPPTAIGTRTVTGMLTPAAGISMGSGARYWAKLTDNDDGDADMSVDSDGEFFMRVMGIQRMGAGRISTYGSTVKNSVSVLEAKLEQDLTLDLSAPFTLYGPNLSPAQGANIFAGCGSCYVDGFNHDGMTLQDVIDGNDVHVVGGDQAAIDVINDDPLLLDATVIRDAVYVEMTGPPDTRANFVGDRSDYPGPGPGVGEPSLRDATALVRADPNPDAQNLFDPEFMMNFVTKAKAIADVVYPNNTVHNGDLGDDGSVAGGSPQVTFCDGDCQFGGTGHGAGLLVVTGRLDWNARRRYRGLILVVGDGEVNIAGNGGGGKGILGGLFVSKITGAPGSYAFATPELTVGGQMRLYFQGSGIRLGASLLPYRLLGWREVTPELEP